MKIWIESTQYVGFWRRLLAVVLDMFLFTMIALLLFTAVYGAAYWQWANASEEALPLFGSWAFLIENIIPAVVTIVCWVKLGATPGKLLLSCQVVDARTLQRPTPRQAVVRYFGYLISALPLGLGFFWIAWDKRKQGFHDKLAGTVVIFELEEHNAITEFERKPV